MKMKMKSSQAAHKISNKCAESQTQKPSPAPDDETFDSARRAQLTDERGRGKDRERDDEIHVVCVLHIKNKQENKKQATNL